MNKVSLVICCFILFVPVLTLGQAKDSLIVKDSTGKIISPKPVAQATKSDTSGKRTFSPRRAAIYSAVLPGLGQIYNKKYWKVPIVYAAVGIPIYFFFDNKTWYNRTRYALAVSSSTNNASVQSYADSLGAVHSQLLNLVNAKATPRILNYRNEFRKNMDYSIIFTLVFWGLNVVDATVDAHLKGFNVSDELTLKIKPTMLTNQTIGVGLVLSFRD